MTIHPTLGWMLVALFGALAAGSLSRLISLRGKPADLVRNRVDSLKTWWVIAPVFAITVVLGQIAVAVVFVVIGWLALSEYAQLVGSRTEDRWLLRVSLLLAPLQYAVICLQWTLAAHLLLPITGLILLSISQTVAGRTKGFRNAVATWYWALLLLVYGPSHAVMLWSLPAERNADVGPAGWFLFMIILTEMNDIAQAFFGRHWGDRKIAPVVSPFKTWVGFCGGVVTTTVLAVSLGPLLTTLDGASAGWSLPGGPGLLQAVAAGLLISVVGFFGDINLSAVKRDVSVKDSGTLLPGQGGILDRIDSLTFTAPAFYFFVSLLA
jgi:phosphatidate cytidylyltransferase